MKTKTCSADGCSSSSKQGIRFFSFPRDPAWAEEWAGKVGLSCTIDFARRLNNKYLCSKYFLDSDFTTAEWVHLDRVAVPCDSDSASQSHPQSPVPSLHTLAFDPLPSVIIPTPYSKTMVHSTVTSIPIHADCLSTSSQTSAVQPPPPTTANTFAAKETSLPLSSVNTNASDGELGHINCQSSSSKPRAKQSLLKNKKELNLASLSELSPRERKLYELIRNKESELCKNKKKYKGNKLKKLCDVDNGPLMQSLSSSLSLDATRFLAAMFRNIRQKPKGRRWNLDEKVLALSP
ncbi:uncharacterized protein LOC111874307 [Cryptotermes secundus]|uniref:uncharacterized protein LOC111874307 n=1 Tax=Cryptotermes secundus TaxID=105785 RepID=UPI000CD7CBFC|nr:uncharacterized protein LOC111874307 [Cryptotermes secundus]